jgi:hypothetical protein
MDILDSRIAATVAIWQFAEQLMIHIHIRGVSSSLSFGKVVTTW